MPASLSAHLYAIEIHPTSEYPLAHFGYINRTTEAIYRPVGTKNRFYQYPGGEYLGQPTAFQVGRYTPAFYVEMTDPVKKLVWVLDNTATANPILSDEKEVLQIAYAGNTLDETTGLLIHRFDVVNIHNQPIVVGDNEYNAITFSDVPNYFSVGATTVTLEAPPDIEVLWTLLGNTVGYTPVIAE